MTDNQHRITPATQRRRQQQTINTSRASSWLLHHEPKPEHADTARPTKGVPRTNTARPNRGGGGHAPAQHQPWRGKQHNRNRNPADDDNPRQTPPHHAPPPRPTGTNTACPTMGAGTHQHSTPNHEGGRTPAQNQPQPGDQHNRNRNPTADHSHPNTPTVRRRRQHLTNKTSRAWRRLKHHHTHKQPESNNAGCQVAHTTTTQAKHHHTTHNRPGRQAATDHAPP